MAVHSNFIKKNIDLNSQDKDGDTNLHLALDFTEIRSILSHPEINPNIKNKYNNNPVEHFLHNHLFGQAYLVSNGGSVIQRSLEQELTKEITEYLEFDVMHNYRYQIILNILYYKVLDKKNIPEYLLKYVDNAKSYIHKENHDWMKGGCPTTFKEGYLEEILWIKNRIPDLSRALIRRSLEEVFLEKKLSKGEEDFLKNVYNPNLTIENAGELIKANDDFASFKSYIGKSLNTTKIEYINNKANQLFIQVYADIIHDFNELVMQENALLNHMELEFFEKDISVYRGMRINDAQEIISSWFKYGYESLSCQKHLSNRGWIENVGKKAKEDHFFPLECNNHFNPEINACMSFSAGGLNAGVVFTSTNTFSIKRFFEGAYGYGKGGTPIVQEFAIQGRDLHLAHQKYESAIHKISFKGKDLKAVYIMDEKGGILTQLVNPYLDSPTLNYQKEINLYQAELHFDLIQKVYQGDKSDTNQYREVLEKFEATRLLGDNNNDIQDL